MSAHIIFDDLSNCSGFYNSGYWTEKSADLKGAQLNLIARLTEALSKRGRILDVACGFGASALYLGQYYEPHQIYGIDISEPRVAACKVASPKGNFSVMSATQLGFGSNFFDDIICIASAVYFEPRDNYLAEAYRVLKVGGRIAMYDVIEKEPGPNSGGISDMGSYRSALVKAGFSAITIDDISGNVFMPFTGYLNGYVTSKNHLDIAEQTRALQSELLTSMSRWKCYVLVFATKA